MGMPLVINTICIVIILMAIYCLAGRKESRGRRINMASMLVDVYKRQDLSWCNGRHIRFRDACER